MRGGKSFVVNQLESSRERENFAVARLVGASDKRLNSPCVDVDDVINARAVAFEPVDAEFPVRDFANENLHDFRQACVVQRSVAHLFAVKIFQLKAETVFKTRLGDFPCQFVHVGCTPRKIFVDYNTLRKKNLPQLMAEIFSMSVEFSDSTVAQAEFAQKFHVGVDVVVRRGEHVAGYRG